MPDAKWKIPDFSPRIGDLTYSYFPNRYGFDNEDLIHKINRNGSQGPLMALDTI